MIPSAEMRAEFHAGEEDVPVEKTAQTEAAEAAKVAKA
jgi:hypothetical protein